MKTHRKDEGQYRGDIRRRSQLPRYHFACRKDRPLDRCPNCSCLLYTSVTLFSFDKGEEISTHESGGDAMVTCLDGVGRITIDGVEHILHEGESIVMPARHPHAVYGQEQFKMLLVVVF